MRKMTRLAGGVAHSFVKPFSGIHHGLTVLGWHRIGRGNDGLTTTPDDFRRHLDVLEEWGAAVLDIEEAMHRLQAGNLPPRAIALTFDDGYSSVVDFAWPLLRERGMPATLFAVSGYLCGQKRFPWDSDRDESLSRLISAAELCDAAKAGLAIGSHTVTHRWLPGLTADQVWREVTQSRGELEEILGRQVHTFAYPMGGWTPHVRQAVELAGYRLAVTVDRGRNRTGQDRHTVRRAFAFDASRDVRLQLDGAYTWMRPIENRRRRREPTW